MSISVQEIISKFNLNPLPGVGGYLLT